MMGSYSTKKAIYIFWEIETTLGKECIYTILFYHSRRLAKILKEIGN